MKRALMLGTAMLAFCGTARAQFGPDPYGPMSWEQRQQLMDQDLQRDRMQDLQRQLDQQRADQQFQLDAQRRQSEEQLREQQLLDNFGCDIHNHCR